MPRLLSKNVEDQTCFARQLRKAGNPAEKYLWSKLKNRKFFGFKFRKQVPIGSYVVDFLCVAKKIVIEIDGDSHYMEGRQEKEQDRDAYLKQCGWNVIHVGHREALFNNDAVLERIRLAFGIEYG